MCTGKWVLTPTKIYREAYNKWQSFQQKVSKQLVTMVRREVGDFTNNPLRDWVILRVVKLRKLQYLSKLMVRQIHGWLQSM